MGHCLLLEYLKIEFRVRVFDISYSRCICIYTLIYYYSEIFSFIARREMRETMSKDKKNIDIDEETLDTDTREPEDDSFLE